MKPSDVLAYRNMLLERAARPPRSIEDAHVEDRWLIRNLREKRCGLYYIAPDMTVLAKAAAETLPLPDIGMSVVPSTTGFMLFDGQPIGGLRHSRHVIGDPPEYEVKKVPALDNVVGVWWHESSPSDPSGLMQVMISPLIREGSMIVSAGGSLFWDQGDADLGHDQEEEACMEDCAARTAIASWLLMGQSLAWTGQDRGDRAERRRMARVGLPLSPVNVVKLRKIERRRDETGELVDWTHRWLVSGHWRQQWYPGSQEHRPIWISPHIKGPEDKPLIIKEKVTAWVR